MWASAGSTAFAASASGMERIFPARSRLTLLPSNAVLLLSNKATSIWSRLTPSGFTSAAIFPSVSPRFTARDASLPDEPSAETAASPDVIGFARFFDSIATGAADCSSTFGAGCITGASVLISGATTDGAGVTLLMLFASGGSSRNVYSRTKRPEDQFSSIKKSRNGSLTGRSLWILK